MIAAHYSGEQWLFLLLFSLLSVMAPFSFYFAGLQHLEPTRAIVVSCLEPVFSIVIAAVALGEIMRPLAGGGDNIRVGGDYRGANAGPPVAGADSAGRAYRVD